MAVSSIAKVKSMAKGSPLIQLKSNLATYRNVLKDNKRDFVKMMAHNKKAANSRGSMESYSPAQLKRFKGYVTRTEKLVKAFTELIKMRKMK